MTTPGTFTDTPNPTASTGTSELLPLPKEGRKDLYLLGTYIGGFPFKIDYTTLFKIYSYYCSTFQVHPPKARALAEKTLYNAKLDTSHDVNFNGSLEFTLSGNARSQFNKIYEQARTRKSLHKWTIIETDPDQYE